MHRNFDESKELTVGGAIGLVFYNANFYMSFVTMPIYISFYMRQKSINNTYGPNISQNKLLIRTPFFTTDERRCSSCCDA
jgi:hypothetical protein